MMPARCPYARERMDIGADVRQFIYHSHRILFTIEMDHVYVHHVRHAAMRNLETIHLSAGDARNPGDENRCSGV